MYGYFRTHRFNLAALAGLCFALFSVSSVAQQLPPGQGVSVDWSPTTSHWQTNGSTFRTPPGVTTSSSTSVGPVTRTPTGGAAQPMGSGITITSIERTGPVSSILRTGPAALRTAVVRCFGNPLCTLGVTGATIGLQELLDRTDWGLDDEGSIVEETPSLTPTGVPVDGYLATWDLAWGGQSSVSLPGDMEYAVSQATQPFNGREVILTYSFYNDSGAAIAVGCFREYNGIPLTGFRYGHQSACRYSLGMPPLDLSGNYNQIPVSPSDITQQVDDHYNFDPSDWPVIGPHIPLNSSDVNIEITSAPSLTTPPITTTEYDADGVPHTITQTNIDYSFSPRPGTNPGPKPALDLEETTTTTSSTADGTVTGSETTTTTRPAGDTTPGTGSGGGSTPDTPWPAFCDWASVVCGWLNWTQEGWDQEEPDFPQIIDFVPEGDFEVGGAGECPAPYTINLGWMLNTSLEVSYQPFCDFAGLVKPLFLAFCYLFAGVITVRSL